MVSTGYFLSLSLQAQKQALGKECLSPKVKTTVSARSHRPALRPRNLQLLSQHSASVAIPASLRRGQLLILSCFSRILWLPLPTVG